MKKKDPRLEKAGVSGYNQPKRTPSHPSKSHIVVAKEGEQVKNTTFEVWKDQVCVESIRAECIKCQRFFYRLFNWKTCNTCGKKNIFVSCK